MDIRKFYLQDAAGARLGLNGEEGVYASEPSGLGIELAPTFGDLGWGFFDVLDDRSRPMKRPAFLVSFTRKAEAYRQYQDFVRFVSAAGDGLLLVYEPWPGAVFFRRVRLRALNKGEKNRVGWLQTSVELNPLTPWFSPNDLRFELASADNVLRYGDGAYDDDGVYTATQESEFGATLQPGGTDPASLQVRFTGEAVRPVLSLTGLVTGMVYGRCVVETTLEAGDVLEYSSRPGDCYCRLIRQGVTTQLDDCMDPSEDPWLRAPTTEPCTLKLTGQGISGAAAVTLNYYYATV